MAFDEVRLDDALARGARGGPLFSNIVIVTASGAEQRVAQWSQGRRHWTVPLQDKTVTEADALVAFFVARQGRLRGFRFKDWSDYSSKVAGVETKHNLRQLTSTTWQLVKRYTSGSVTHVRDIKKPAGDTLTDTAATQANSTVSIYNGSNEITNGWTVNLTTGVVTFDPAPGYTPSATFQFDVPVRFDSDRMELTLEDTRVRSWEIDVVEVRV